MTSETRGKFLGVALIARRPCGRIAAMAWTDAYRHGELDAMELEWKRRGLEVRREPRHDGDPWPEWIGECKGPCACEGERAVEQETKMEEPRMTAAEIRSAHRNMENIIQAAIAHQISIFERETGLDVQGVDVRMITVQAVGSQPRTIVESVSVRVGLGR